MAGDGAGPEREALARLEEAVTAALERLGTLRARAERAEGRAAELEDLLRNFASGQEDPGRLADRVRALEVENGDLRGRLDEGRAAAERILARIRFLEENR